MTLTVGDGEFLVLLGPTGAGKTTTLRLVAGLERPDAGRVLLGGRDVTREPPAARDTTFVFQQYSLYPHLTVYDNLAFPLRSPAHREPEARIRARIDEIARLLHIEDKLANRATQLSGGQMQRVAIGRALVRRPSIYLMDEPLSSLDAKLRAELRVELKRIQRELGATILYVTHDQTEAMTMATHIGVLDQGRLVQIGSPRAIYTDPVNTYVATRLGSPGDQSRPARGSTPTSRRRPRRRRSACAPSMCASARARTAARSGRVKWIEHLGDQNHLHVTIADTDVVTLCDRDAGLAVGDAVDVELTAPLVLRRQRRTRSRELSSNPWTRRCNESSSKRWRMPSSATPTS